MSFFRFWLLILVLASCTAGHPTGNSAELPVPRLLRREQPLMGTRFEIQVVATDEQRAAIAVSAAFAEVARVEALISEWQESSEMTRLNRQAGVAPVPVGDDMLAMFEAATEISKLTDGAFDVTFAGCGHLWSVREQRIPAQGDIDACLPLVSYARVVIDRADSTIFLPEPKMRAGSGAIGKGYGVDRAAEVLRAHDFHDFVVDGGGDIRVSGSRFGQPWTVGVADPRNPDELLGTLRTSDSAVVTSGDYERYFEVDGVRYHHIIDPRTGRPATASIAVTVVAPTATVADALATGIFVLGPERGLAIAQGLPATEVFVVAPDRSQHATPGWWELFQPAATAEAP